jgi:excisionase family DNA binding protein
LKSERLNTTSAPEDDLITIDDASALIRLAKPTIYFLTSQSKIPVIKKGKRLFFSKIELLDWLKSGRIVTTEEINNQSREYIQKRKAFRV